MREGRSRRFCLSLSFVRTCPGCGGLSAPPPGRSLAAKFKPCSPSASPGPEAVRTWSRNIAPSAPFLRLFLPPPTPRICQLVTNNWTLGSGQAGVAQAAGPSDRMQTGCLTVRLASHTLCGRSRVQRARRRGPLPCSSPSRPQGLSAEPPLVRPRWKWGDPAMKQGAGHGKSRETWGGPEPEHLVKHPKAFHRASLHMQSGSHTSTDGPAQPPSSLPGARPSLWGQGTARASRPPDGHKAPRAGPGRGALGGEATSLFDQIRTCLRDGHRCHRCHRYWATKCRVRSLGGGTACSLSSPPSSGPCGQASRQADKAPARTSLGRRGQETGPPEAGVPVRHRWGLSWPSPAGWPAPNSRAEAVPGSPPTVPCEAAKTLTRRAPAALFII